jgi:hypothetical protein
VKKILTCQSVRNHNQDIVMKILMHQSVNKEEKKENLEKKAETNKAKPHGEPKIASLFCI